MDKEVHLYKDACTKAVEYPYLKHTVNKSIHDIHFVPYEDVLGIGHSSGFSSILVPGEQNLALKIGKLTQTYTRISFTNFKYEAHAITGNGNNTNVLKLR